MQEPSLGEAILAEYDPLKDGKDRTKIDRNVNFASAVIRALARTQWVPCDKKNEKKTRAHSYIIQEYKSDVDCRGTTTTTTTIIGGRVSKKTIKDEACCDYRSWTSNDGTGHRLFKKKCHHYDVIKVYKSNNKRTI